MSIITLAVASNTGEKSPCRAVDGSHKVYLDRIVSRAVLTDADRGLHIATVVGTRARLGQGVK